MFTFEGTLSYVQLFVFDDTMTNLTLVPSEFSCWWDEVWKDTQSIRVIVSSWMNHLIQASCVVHIIIIFSLSMLLAVVIIWWWWQLWIVLCVVIVWVVLINVFLLSIVLWLLVTGICTVQIGLTSIAIVCHIISICICCIVIMFASHIILDTSQVLMACICNVTFSDIVHVSYMCRWTNCNTCSSTLILAWCFYH